MKKRTLSQHNGDSGEKFFDQFADRYLGLVPTKVPNDYGIDFFNQVAKSLPERAQDIRPTIIGAVVKSTGKKSRRPRAQLGKKDIELAFKSDFPLLYVLVDLNKDYVYLRFFDKELLTLFHETLVKGGQTFTLSPKIMLRGPEGFREALNHVTRQEYQQSLHIKAAELRLSNIIGKTRLSIRSDGHGGIAVLEVSHLENLFSPQDHAQIRDVLLTSNYDYPLLLPPSPFKESIVGEVKHLASKIALVAPLASNRPETLFIKKGNFIKARCIFDLRWAGDEMSYHHQTGISIIISAARKGDDGLYYHHTRITYGDDSADRIFEHPEIISFIKECKKGAKMHLSEHSKEAIQITDLSELIRLQVVLSDIELIYRELQLHEPALKFHHLKDDKIQWSHGLLASLFHTRAKEDIWPGFVTTSEEIPIDWVKSTIFCPLLVALPEGPSVIQIMFSGKMGIVENNPVGARFDKYRAMRICDPSEYGGKLTEQPQSPVLLIDGENAIKFREKGFDKINSPCRIGISYRTEF
jgi:hypothetical protein